MGTRYRVSMVGQHCVLSWPRSTILRMAQRRQERYELDTSSNIFCSPTISFAGAAEPRSVAQNHWHGLQQNQGQEEGRARRPGNDAGNGGSGHGSGGERSAPKIAACRRVCWRCFEQKCPSSPADAMSRISSELHARPAASTFLLLSRTKDLFAAWRTFVDRLRKPRRRCSCRLFFTSWALW